MLFDLRGAGRRTTIKVVYVFLAILMGGGLILFGIGGSVSGGLVDAITGSGSNTAPGSEEFQTRARAAEAKARANPQDAALWAAAARARYQYASTEFDQAQGVFTDAGKQQLEAAATAWEKHLELAKNKPDDGVAGLMVQAYSSVGLNEPAKAVAAQEIITEERPKATTFATLAILAYEAGQTRKGDLASKQALSMVDEADKESMKAQLDQAKQQSLQQQVQEATQSPTATPTPAKKKSKKKKDSGGG
jgi:hypothetical protein